MMNTADDEADRAMHRAFRSLYSSSLPSSDVIRKRIQAEIKKNLDSGRDPFKRPWVSGRRPWQFKDRPKFAGKSIDWIVFDEAIAKPFNVPDVLLKDGTCIEYKTAKRWAEADFAKIEERIMAHYQDAFYGTSLWHSQQRAKAVMEGKCRLDNSRRMIP